MVDAEFRVDVVLNLKKYGFNSISKIMSDVGIDKIATQGKTAQDILDGVGSKMRKASQDAKMLGDSPMFKAEQIGNSVSELKKIGYQMHDIETVFGKNSKQMDEFRKGIGKSKKELEQAYKATTRMSFGFLSAIFAGQLLLKTVGGFVSGFIKTYSTMTDKNTEFNKSTLRLSSAFEFLKFKIGESFANNPLVKEFTKLLTDLLNFIAGNQGLVDTIAVLSIALLGLGAALFLKGQGTTVLMGLTELFGFISTATIPTAATTFGSGIGLAILAGIGTVLTVAAVGLAISVVFDELSKKLKKDILGNEVNAPSIDIRFKDSNIVNKEALKEIGLEYSNINGGLQKTIGATTELDVKTGLLSTTLDSQSGRLSDLKLAFENQFKPSVDLTTGSITTMNSEMANITTTSDLVKTDFAIQQLKNLETQANNTRLALAKVNGKSNIDIFNELYATVK